MKNKTNWIFPEDTTLSDELVEFAGSKIIAQLLSNRGITSIEQADLFLNPEKTVLSSPSSFSEMDKSVERICKAIDKSEHIVIYGDFDADGVTSTSLLYKTLKHLNADVSYYIPCRKEEGHGLNSGSVCKLISGRKAKLIITVDCGISNMVEITLAGGFGTDVIITDHHEAHEVIPLAFSIINPKSPKSLSENLTPEQIKNLKGLAGVGVAYKLAEALLEKFNKSDFKDEILPLVAIGTIADVVPLIGENRCLVLKGLSLISEKRPKGIIKLLETAGFDTDKKFAADMISFAIAPRINAAGRLGAASTAVELLTEEDELKIELCAKKLDQDNRTRKQMCETTFMEAEQKIFKELDLEKNKAVILFDENWHPGIIGIVASKIVEKYYRPAFLISIDREKNEARCSARSIKGINLHETLSKHSDMLKHFGGHAMAAGFCLDMDKVNLNEFIKALNSTVNKNFDSSFLNPKLNIDAEILSEDLNTEFIEKINELAPFGEGNPSPIFSISNLSLKQFKKMGAAKNHLKLFFSDSENRLLEGVWWNKNSLNIELLETVNTAFSPRINTFKGKSVVQLEVKDIKLTNSSVEIEENSSLGLTDLSVPKWVDHRKRLDIEKAVTSYLKTAKDKISVFAENRITVEMLEKNTYFKERLVNRLNVEKCDQIMFFDLPPGNLVLLDVLEKSKATVVHLMGVNQITSDSNLLIKTLSGMLKFAHTNRDGKINVEELASKLCLSIKAIEECIKLLGSAGIIKIVEMQNGKVDFKFIKVKEISSVIVLDEYFSVLEEMDGIEEFRGMLANDEILQIQNKFNLELKKDKDELVLL